MKTEQEIMMVLSALVWKYGEVSVDDKEIETHAMKITYNDFINFGHQTLEVMHDDENKVSYYRVRKV